MTHEYKKTFVSHYYELFDDMKKIGSELRVLVIDMTQLYFSLELDIENHNDSNFLRRREMKFQKILHHSNSNLICLRMICIP